MTKAELFRWWPLLVLIAIFAVLAFVFSPANLKNMPYVILKILIGLWIAHKVHRVAFAGRKREEPEQTGIVLAGIDIAAAIVTGGIVIAMALSL